MLGIKILEERKSRYNGNLRVVKGFGLGTYIQAGGLTQSGGIVETFWRQTLNKIKKFRIRKVLILGLGGGTVAKLVRKLWPQAKIVGVDIDPVMVELGKKYLGLDKVGIDIKVQDAVKEISGKFDLIVIDMYNGDRFPKKFESNIFLASIRRRLSGTGIIIFNRLYYKAKEYDVEKFGQKLEKVFKKVEPYRPVTNLMFICSTKKENLADSDFNC